MVDGFVAEEFLRDVLGAKNIHIKGNEVTHACLLIDHENDYKEPGASLNSEKLLYNCWKCGSGGTLLWLVEEVLQVSSSKARQLIKDHFESDAVHEETFLQGIENMWADSPSQSMPRYSLRIVEGWRCYTKFMDERGISRGVQKEMLTGLNKGNIDEVSGELINQPRIVMPHVFGGKLVGWTMRKADPRQAGNKYKHTSQFPKKNTLYNYDNLTSLERVIVVESPMSVLKLKSVGIDDAVATFGAEINSEQVRLLKSFDEVIAFPDGDPAGYRAMRKVDRKGNTTGLVPDLAKSTTLYIVDHGSIPGPKWSEDGGLNPQNGMNEMDAGDYTGDEVRSLIKEKVLASSWDWRDESVFQKVHANQGGPGSDESWD